METKNNLKKSNMDKFFKITERGSNYRKEIVGGLTTFSSGIPFEDAVRMASATPAKVMGCYDRVGSLEEGKDADVVLMNKDYDVTGVWSAGTRVF